MSGTTTVIVGGGFGGIAAANALRLAVPGEHEILVIDETSHFHVGAGKTWIMLGERTFDDISRPRESLLDPGVHLLQATVTHIDPTERTVTADGRSLHWDHLVIALGATLNPGIVPGLAETAHTFYTVAGAQRLRGALEDFTSGDIVILIPRVPFKCPPAPYEAALLLRTALAERTAGDAARIALYTTERAPMATAGPEMAAFIKGELAARDIGFYPEKSVVRVDGSTQHIHFEDGTVTPYDLLIAVPPHEAPQVVKEAGLTDASGWIPVDPETLEIRPPSGTPAVWTDVYAIGDIATVPLPGSYRPDMPLSLPKAGVFAEAHGRVVADRIAARILGRTPGGGFDGKGFCYLETGGGRAVRADGSFFALPHPSMQKRPADEDQFQDKLDWVDRLLTPQHDTRAEPTGSGE
jgi:sulfide:quinone oxidoreductase